MNSIITTKTQIFVMDSKVTKGDDIMELLKMDVNTA